RLDEPGLGTVSFPMGMALEKEIFGQRENRYTMKHAYSLRFWRTPFILLALCVLALFSLLASGQTPTAPPDPELTKTLDALLDGPELQTGSCGVCIQSLQDQPVLYERNADRVFLPPSNNKLLTSAAALGILGPDFPYTPRLAYTGSLDADGTL